MGQAQAAGSARARRGSGTGRASRVRPPIKWHRVGRVALLLTLATIVLLYIPPFMHWMEQRGTAAHGRAELEDLRREHDRLETRLRQLQGPGAIEREARRLGMVRRGERPYVVLGAPER